MDRIPTGHPTLDAFLNGGLPAGHCIEFCGNPGTGKTLLAFLVARRLLQVDPEAVVIVVDTTGTFPLERVLETTKDRDVLQRILVILALTLEELLESVSTIATEIEAGTKIKMVIVDNVSVPFRIVQFNTAKERAETIQDFGLRWRSLMGEHECTLLFVNHMTTRFEGERAVIVPALGATWSELVDLRLLLEQDECARGRRWLSVHKSDYESLPRHSLRFEIHDRGINFL